MPTYTNNINNDHFDFSTFGKCMIRPQPPWQPFTRDDIIQYDPSLHEKELNHDLRSSNSGSFDISSELIRIIKKYSNRLDTAGCKRTIFGFLFSIDTGSAAPVCCKKSSYDIMELKSSSSKSKIFFTTDGHKNTVAPMVVSSYLSQNGTMSNVCPLINSFGEHSYRYENTQSYNFDIHRGRSAALQCLSTNDNICGGTLKIQLASRSIEQELPNDSDEIMSTYLSFDRHPLAP